MTRHFKEYWELKEYRERKFKEIFIEMLERTFN